MSVSAEINGSELTLLSRTDVITAMLVAALGGVAVAWYGGFVAGDDTFIYMRYVGQALRGEHFTYNAGESSFGVTSPVWTLMMTPVAAILGNTVAVWKGTATLLSGARTGLLFSLCRRLGAPRAYAAALAFLALAEPHTFRWSASGMENALVLLALTGVAWLYVDAQLGTSRPVALGAALGVLPFIRPELGLFSAGITLLLLQLRSRRSRVVVVAAGVTVACCAVVTFVLFGGLLPQTAAAKALFLRQVDPLYALVTGLKILVSGSAGALVVLAISRWDNRWGRGWLAVSVGAVVLAIAYLAFRNQLVSTRYGSYLSAPLVLAAVLIVVRQRRPLILAALGMQAAGSIVLLAYLFPVTRVEEEAQIRGFAQLAAERTPADARIALSEIGAFGFYSQRYIVDLFGLVDRETLRWAVAHGKPSSQRDLEGLLKYRRATHYVEAFGEELPIAGATLNFRLLGEASVDRNNFSQGHISSAKWRLYELSEIQP